LWAPPNPNSEIGNTEAEEVAWCTATGEPAFASLSSSFGKS